MDEVLVKNGRNASVYHKSKDGKPACLVNGNDDPDNWTEWELSKAKNWKDACQNPQCYGDGELNGVKTGDTWPV